DGEQHPLPQFQRSGYAWSGTVCCNFAGGADFCSDRPGPGNRIVQWFPDLCVVRPVPCPGKKAPPPVVIPSAVVRREIRGPETRRYSPGGVAVGGNFQAFLRSIVVSIRRLVEMLHAYQEQSCLGLARE